MTPNMQNDGGMKVPELKLRNKQRLRKKETREMSDALFAAAGVRAFGETDNIDVLEAPQYKVVEIGSERIGILLNEKPFLTVKGLMKFGAAERRAVTVDMGAVPFVTKGADLMIPGIRQMDMEIKAGDWCYIRDEKNRRPLAVGVALMDAQKIMEMKSAGQKGKAVKVVHYVGDELWNSE